jgi:AraC family transcriptional regulator, alkane utilization regulator
MDRLLSLLPRFSFQASVFFHGPFNGESVPGADESAGRLHLVRSGSLVIAHQDGSVLNISDPTLVFYPRPLEHRLLVPPGTCADLTCVNVRFKHAKRNPIALALPPVIRIPLADSAAMAPVLGLLIEESERDGIGARLVLDHLCDILAVHLVRHALGRGLIDPEFLGGLWDAQLAPALAALHHRPGHSWTIEEMASEAHMSRTAFANRFREVVGVPPAEYLTIWRMELAQTYLKEGRAVKEVAPAVGYRTQPAFTRAFAARYRVSPTEWLRSAAAASLLPAVDVI